MIKVGVATVQPWHDKDDGKVTRRGATITAEVWGPPATPLEDLEGVAYILTEQEAADLRTFIRMVANIPADIELPNRARALLAAWENRRGVR